jgi:hypothetical protein
MFGIVDLTDDTVDRFVGYSGFTLEEAASSARDACNGVLERDFAPFAEFPAEDFEEGDTLHQCEAIASGCLDE